MECGSKPKELSVTPNSLINEDESVVGWQRLNDSCYNALRVERRLLDFPLLLLYTDKGGRYKNKRTAAFLPPCPPLIFPHSYLLK